MLCLCEEKSTQSDSSSWFQKFALNFSTPILKWWLALSPNTVTESFLALISALTTLGRMFLPWTQSSRKGRLKVEQEWTLGREPNLQTKMEERKSYRVTERKMDDKRISQRLWEAKKKMFTSAHLCRAHMSVSSSPLWYTQGRNDECILSQSPLSSPATILLLTDQELLHYSELLLFWKWTPLRINVELSA